MAIRFRTLAAASFIVPLAMMAGCSANQVTAAPAGTALAPGGGHGTIPSSPAPAAVSLIETGSTLLYPLFGAWASAYHQQFSSVSFTTAPTGSGTGIADASSGHADIGASDAFLSSGNLVQNPSLLNIPLAIAAQQINYNLPHLAQGVHVRLNGAVLAAMYEGKITSWNDPAIARPITASACRPSRSCRCTGQRARATRSCSPVTCPPMMRAGTPRSATGQPSRGRTRPARGAKKAMTE
ncbi:MAG TPA: substrate-binding domain-containing protein [Streptosporangiaceae bacterium]|nr:substrate-binding domain-containing protein [Streptosporangiaceae bacterium]